MSTRASRAGLLVWMAALTAGLAVLHGAGAALPPPPMSEPGQLGAWLAQQDPAEAAVSVVRTLTYVTGWYLLASTVVGALARRLRVGRLVHAADAVTVRPVRGMLNRAMGLSMAATVLTASVAGAAPRKGADRPGIEVMARLPDAGAASPPVTMRRLPDRPPSPSTGVMEQLSPQAAPPPDVTPPRQASWTVRPGDHFWSVAEKTLAAAWNRAPSDAETGPYWVHLIAANRHVLRDPRNPDLLFPGQVLVVPAPPAA